MILAKTIKGYGMGEAGEGQNITHQQKKMNEKALLAFRDRFGLRLSDDEVREGASSSRPTTAPEMRYLHERRKALGGAAAVAPATAARSRSRRSGVRRPARRHRRAQISTTMAFVRILNC